MARRTVKLIQENSLLGAAAKTRGLSAGLDEAGRGCLAGPVVAAAVVFADGFDLVGLDDSKVLKAAERQSLAVEIRQLALGWGVGLAWMREIDKINILQASLLAMARSVAALRKRMGTAPEVNSPDLLKIDGNQVVPPAYFRILGLPVPEQESIVHGDALVPSISAASILAKTFRDDLLDRFDKRYPGYGFAGHKGYGTKEHRAAIERLGPCPLHRISFRSVRPEPKIEQGRLC